ncbi:hypothetical protein HNQ94_002532 [Salirhabdus euzebyi]|uniref:YtzI protein n=1 Tax=Salirhabdus euzebyi TaxID=394506 RepID=A0A841Q6P7_9BACI|nr:YtzI protein [Salirhabdus euzebyi]MBB6454081.1 hypothetical protein [Salirhabdus euzebyi]
MFWLLVCIAIVLAVLGLSLMAISKGYSYQHKIDPLPGDEDNTEEENKTGEKG